jgi:hypothetical protein
MNATLKLKAEQLAAEIASQAKTLDDVNGLLNVLCSWLHFDQRNRAKALDEHVAQASACVVTCLRCV